MKQIIINLKPRYCTECGKALMLREVLTGEFDKDTGAPITRILQTCPEYLKGRGFWGGFKWMGHDSVEVFSIKRIF